MLKLLSLLALVAGVGAKTLTMTLYMTSADCSGPAMPLPVGLEYPGLPSGCQTYTDFATKAKIYYDMVNGTNAQGNRAMLVKLYPAKLTHTDCSKPLASGIVQPVLMNCGQCLPLPTFLGGNGTTGLPAIKISGECIQNSTTGIIPIVQKVTFATFTGYTGLVKSLTEKGYAAANGVYVPANPLKQTAAYWNGQVTSEVSSARRVGTTVAFSTVVPAMHAALKVQMSLLTPVTLATAIGGVKVMENATYFATVGPTMTSMTPATGGPMAAAAKTCPIDDAHMTGRRGEHVTLFCLMLLGITVAIVYFTMEKCTAPTSFSDSTGPMWWAHMLIAFLTIVLTLIGLVGKEVYKYSFSIKVASMKFNVDVFINFWKLVLETTNAASGEMTNLKVDVNCCLQVPLGALGNYRVIDFSEYDRCGVLRVLQACSILVVLMSVFAVLVLCIQRFYPDGGFLGIGKAGGFLGRIVFGISSIISILSILLTNDLRNTLDKAVKANQNSAIESGELIYSWGYYIWIIAMVLKLIAAALVGYEVCCIATKSEDVSKGDVEMNGKGEGDSAGVLT